MKILDIEDKRQLSREAVAAWLHDLADSLARHNSVEFRREGLPYIVEVPDEVDFEVELEISDDGGSLEIEIDW
jgi:amphi-Trp domain-containing protein